MDIKNNSGNCNSGNSNSGNSNSGNWNSGDWNSGDSNSGDWNSGDRNSGNWNSGNWNSGNWNSGDRNSGNWNSGNWNSGYWNSGYLNTTEPKIRIFNLECDVERDDLEFPDFFYFDLTEWIVESDMSQKEKEDNEQYKVTGGYLKVKEYKEAWRESWNEADIEDRQKVLELPNWNNSIFLEITGIDVEKELNQKNDATVEAIELLKSKGYKIVKE